MKYLFHPTSFSPSKLIVKSNEPYVIPETNLDMPEYYSFFNKSKKVDTWLENTQSTGLIVIKDGKIGLIGIAIENGFINSVEDKVEKYIPELIGVVMKVAQLKMCCKCLQG